MSHRIFPQQRKLNLLQLEKVYNKIDEKVQQVKQTFNDKQANQFLTYRDTRPFQIESENLLNVLKQEHSMTNLSKDYVKKVRTSLNLKLHLSPLSNNATPIIKSRTQNENVFKTSKFSKESNIQIPSELWTERTIESSKQNVQKKCNTSFDSHRSARKKKFTLYQQKAIKPQEEGPGDAREKINRLLTQNSTREQSCKRFWIGRFLFPDIYGAQRSMNHLKPDESTYKVRLNPAKRKIYVGQDLEIHIPRSKFQLIGQEKTDFNVSQKKIENEKIQSNNLIKGNQMLDKFKEETEIKDPKLLFSTQLVEIGVQNRVIKKTINEKFASAFLKATEQMKMFKLKPYDLSNL